MENEFMNKINDACVKHLQDQSYRVMKEEKRFSFMLENMEITYIVVHFPRSQQTGDKQHDDYVTAITDIDVMYVLQNPIIIE